MSDLASRSKAQLKKQAMEKKKVFAPPISKMNKQQLINYIEGTKAPSFRRSDYKMSAPAPKKDKKKKKSSLPLSVGGQMRPRSKMVKNPYKGDVNKNPRL